MSKTSYIRHLAAFVAAINITTDLDGDGTPAAPTDWIHLPGGEGDTITITDMSGHSTTLTATDQVSVWSVRARTITAASGAFTFGTGEAPAQGSKGDKGDTGDTGVTGNVSFTLPILTVIPAGTTVPEIILGTNCTADEIDLDIPAGFTFEGGATTAHDTNYNTLVLLTRDANQANPTVLGTWTTKITGGTGNWPGTAGTKVAMAYSAQLPSIPPGGSLRLKITPAGSGVATPLGTFEALVA